MIKHIVLWTLKSEFSPDEKHKIKEGIKQNLEALRGKIDGLYEIRVITEGLSTSTVDVMLDSTLENFEALKLYATHPAHVAAADGFVRPYTETRACMDFEV